MLRNDYRGGGGGKRLVWLLISTGVFNLISHQLTFITVITELSLAGYNPVSPVYNVYRTSRLPLQHLCMPACMC